MQVAVQAVMRFNPDAKVVAHHSNVKNAEFGIEYFKQFDIVMNALDNVSARRCADAFICFWLWVSTLVAATLSQARQSCMFVSWYPIG